MNRRPSNGWIRLATPITAIAMLLCGGGAFSAPSAVGAAAADPASRVLDADVNKRWLGTTAEPGEEARLSESQVRKLLRSAAEVAVVRSPQLAQMRAEWEAARLDVEQAKGARWPKVQIGLSSESLGLGAGTKTNTPGAASVLASLPVFDWGYLSNLIESRSSLEQAGELKWVAGVEGLVYEVCTNLVEQNKATIIAQASSESIARIQALVRMLTDIVAVDRGRASELTQARAKLLQAEAARDASVAKVRTLRIALHRLIGDASVTPPSEGEWELGIGTLETTLAAAAQHPSIAQASAEAEAARRTADAARASLLPQLNFAVSKTTQRDGLGRIQPWQAGLSVNWTAFEGGSARAAELAARQRANASEMRKDQLREDVEFQVRTAFEDANTLAQRATAYRGLVAETEQVRRLFFEQWYHLGRRSLLDVLQAENEYYINKVAMHTTQFDSYQAVLKMYASSGTLVQWLGGVDQSAGAAPLSMLRSDVPQLTK
ncbi:adhesin transport system outer membrane protein [Variovorax boronicumulans]|uniref:TolC family protein n=1 Tax=Variovorax boronicumulans TaxID=436515 RepID=UPI00277F968B|nr:TolC family protein [Variovorax boronicumulans]MDQ0086127.1 adhesin transport system outer membrane protein [Variovorax boronicumulans]